MANRYLPSFELALAHMLVLSVPVASQAPQRVPPTRAAVAPSGRYTLAPTQNVWTSLLLDTSTGRIWQVNFTLDDSLPGGRVALNEDALVPLAGVHIGRFALQETQNVYTFLLLDQDDGRVWQVQWSFDADKRGIVRQLSESIP